MLQTTRISNRISRPKQDYQAKTRTNNTKSHHKAIIKSFRIAQKRISGDYLTILYIRRPRVSYHFVSHFCLRYELIRKQGAVMTTEGECML